MGELWVLLDFTSAKSKKLFQDNIGAISWFSQVKDASLDFTTEGRINLPRLEVGQEYFREHQNHISTEDFWIRVNEVPGWVPDFLDKDEDDSDMESNGGDPSIQDDDNHVVIPESELEMERHINATPADVFISQKENQSEDPFGIYDLLNKASNIDGVLSDHSLTHPPGFTPNTTMNEFNINVENVNSQEVSTNQGDNYVSQGPLRNSSDSACSCHFKKSTVSRTGGSILGLMEELDYLLHVIQGWNGEVILMGDFNEVRHNSDRFGSLFHAHGANMFSSFISNAGLMEVSFGGSSFTWCHKSATKMSKLDRFLIFENLFNSCPNITAITLDRYISDHRPILLRESYLDYGPSPFKFYHYWLKTKGFDKLVSDTWRDTPIGAKNAMNSLSSKLKYLKSKIKDWTKTNTKDMHSGRTKLKNDLQVLDASIDDSNGIVETVKNVLSEQSIRGILIDGVWTEDPQLVKSEFFNHFSKRFAKPDINRAHLDMCKLLAVASLIFWQWQQPSLAVGTYTASGNT
nr:RNA-directed DNA polymerase, eukaryota [Tanacetum cinerariifolium]